MLQSKEEEQLLSPVPENATSINADATTSGIFFKKKKSNTLLPQQLQSYLLLLENPKTAILIVNNTESEMSWIFLKPK